MNSIDKHSLWKGDCDIYLMVSKYIVLIGINERGMRTHLSLSSGSYLCWHLQRVSLRSARRRSQRCAGLWQRSGTYWIWNVLTNFKNKNIFPMLVCWFLLAEKNASKMFCHDPEQQWVLLPFPIVKLKFFFLPCSLVELLRIYLQLFP